MLSIVNEKEAPEGRSAEGHAWMRRSAAQVLATLGDVGAKQKNNVLAALGGIVKDADAPLSLRCALAQNFPGTVEADVSNRLRITNVIRTKSLKSSWARSRRWRG